MLFDLVDDDLGFFIRRAAEQDADIGIVEDPLNDMRHGMNRGLQSAARGQNQIVAGSLQLP